LKKVPLLDHEIKGHHSVFAKDVMTKNVAMIQPKMRVAEILEVLESTDHHGYVVVRDRIGKHPEFLGLILRSQLEGLLVKRVFCWETDTGLESAKRRGSIDEVVMTTRAGDAYALVKKNPNTDPKPDCAR